MLAKANRINVSKINLQYVASASVNSALTGGKVDAILQFCHNMTTIVKAGTPAAVFWFKDSGINILGGSIIASTSTIQNKPDVVRQFLTGFYTTEKFAVTNPSDAMSAFSQAVPSWNTTVAMSAWNPYILTTIGYDPSVVAKTNNVLSLGYFNTTKLQSTTNVMMQGLNIPSVDPSAVYTSQFVGNTPPPG